MSCKQIEGHRGGNYRSTDVHRNYCSGPLGDDWNDITHSEEINLLLHRLPQSAAIAHPVAGTFRSQLSTSRRVKNKGGKDSASILAFDAAITPS
jgi:hypothetical protein